MIRLCASPLLLSAWLLPAAGWAQDRARLDDFALPAASPEPIQQIAPAREAVAAAPRQDRSLSIPALPAAPQRTLPQISSTDERAPAQAQLAPAERNTAAPSPLSAPGDSRPQPSLALTGPDRCDPQSGDSRDLARCRRILELRAAEFRASERPVLSAEQELLVAQQLREDNKPLQPATGMRLARTEPDPNQRSNQELAAVVLGTSQQPERAGEPDQLPEQGAINDILQALAAGSLLSDR